MLLSAIGVDAAEKIFQRWWAVIGAVELVSAYSGHSSSLCTLTSEKHREIQGRPLWKTQQSNSKLISGRGSLCAICARR